MAVDAEPGYYIYTGFRPSGGGVIDRKSDNETGLVIGEPYLIPWSGSPKAKQIIRLTDPEHTWSGCSLEHIILKPLDKMTFTSTTEQVTLSNEALNPVPFRITGPGLYETRDGKFQVRIKEDRDNEEGEEYPWIGVRLSKEGKEEGRYTYTDGGYFYDDESQDDYDIIRRLS